MPQGNRYLLPAASTASQEETDKPSVRAACRRLADGSEVLVVLRDWPYRDAGLSVQASILACSSAGSTGLAM